MFEVGDYVVYGTNGVCTVDSVGKIDSGIFDNKKNYYTLVPYYARSGKIYVPVDSDKVTMRKVLTKDQALEFIDSIKDIEGLWITDEKTRELSYKEAFRTHDCAGYVRIIKTIYHRMEERTAEKKKLTSTDERYFKMVEDYLYGELGISLSMEKEKVKEFLIDKLGQGQTEAEKQA